MDCVRGIASLPVGDEPTEEVYLVPDTGKPGAKYYKVRLIPILSTFSPASYESKGFQKIPPGWITRNTRVYKLYDSALMILEIKF